MRKYVYQTLSIIHISDPSLLTMILDKVLITLQIYKSDKKHLYKMLMSLGKIYQHWIGSLVDSFAIMDSSEPNWKNAIYKAKMVFCYCWWKQLKDRSQTPYFFGRHMLYLKDVEPYLFED
jgi:hypothetical protein